MHIGIYAGRLGRDASVKTLESGKTVTELALAVDIGWGDKKETQWVDAAWWGDRGQKLAPYLTKGKQLTLLGRQTFSTYTAKDGAVRVKIKLDVLECAMQGGGEPRSDSAPAPRRAPAKPADDAFADDDLTF